VKELLNVVGTHSENRKEGYVCRWLICNDCVKRTGCLTGPVHERKALRREKRGKYGYFTVGRSIFEKQRVGGTQWGT